MRRIGSLIKEIHCQAIIRDCRQYVNLYQTNQSDANGQRTTDTRLRIIQRAGNFLSSSADFAKYLLMNYVKAY